MLDCKPEERPLTAEVETDFGLAELRTFLARPHNVVGRPPRSRPDANPPELATAAIDIAFELDDFVYVETTADYTDCADTAYAAARIRVAIGDGLVAFEAEGSIRKRRRASTSAVSRPR
jgi:hypothetical protein